MAYKDLREFMKLLDKRGLLVRVKAEVEPEWEINGVTNKLTIEGGPAVVFENVKGHKVPVLAGLIGTQERLALALEMDAFASGREITEEWLKRVRHPIPPKLVKNGPCKENILVGEKADINTVCPLVRWHKLDGGSYIGTMAMQVTRDLETGCQNTGIYRMMYISKDETTLYMPAFQHGGQHLLKWQRLFPGKPMPIAAVIGTDPAYLLAAAAKFGHPPAEDAYAGGLRREALELVKCETCDLEVPAASEIVLEGEVYPEELKPDGPFGEYPGYEGGVQNVNRFHLRAITHRNNPIFQGTREGWISESDFIWLRGMEYIAYDRLRKFPGVKDVHIPGSGVGYHMIVSLRKSWAGQVNQVMQAVWGDVENGPYIKHIIVVDEDVDIHNPDHVLWAIATHVQPHRDVVIIPPPCPTEGLDPSQPYSKRFWGSKMGIDATMPVEEYEAEGREPPPLCDDPDIKAKVEAQWERYGINI